MIDHGVRAMWNCPVTDLQPGDIWDSGDQVLVTEVGASTDLGPRWVRVSGQIVKGFGKSKRIHAWNFHPELCVDIFRPTSQPTKRIEK